MAKVKILGRAVEITSNYDFDTLQDVEKYAPEELKLFDKDDNITFKVATGKGVTGGIGANYVNFVKPVKSGNAVVNFMYEGEDDVKEYVANTYGGALMNLNKVEEKLVNVIKQMKADKAEVLANINVVEDAPVEADMPAEEE